MTRGRTVTFTTPCKKPFKTIFQFKITLLETQPPVWRRIQVPGYYTFYDLHVAIQNAMGWTDSHLHVFEIGAGRKRPIRIESPYALDDLFEEAKYFTPNTSLARFFAEEKDSAVYEYDFGDCWRHEVLLEDIMLRKAGVKYPACLAGELACPPEDCGGTGGYGDCVRMAQGKTGYEEGDENHNLKVWLGDWRPEKFDAKDVAFKNPRKRFLDTMGAD